MRHDLVLVDTSGWICFFARKGFPEVKKTVSELLDENRVAVTGPVVIELIQGCRNEAEKRQIERCLQGVQWLAVRDEHWFQATELAFSLRRKGVTVSVTDALIAALAMAHHCSLLHRDQDYDLIAKHYSELKIHNVRHS